MDAFLLGLCSFGLLAGQPTQVGAKLVKAELGLPGTQPEVVVLDQPDRWRLLTDEAHTGVNAHEFYFTLEATEKLAPPRVEVHWPGVRIDRVLGLEGEAERLDDGVRFQLRAGRAPTGIHTPIPAGRNINLLIFHNWEVRRAGPYRDGAWPQTEIDAQLCYLFAAAAAAQQMGLADAADPSFIGDVRLYGFETNFPNGHTDHPPHFHIMLAWPGWLNTQVSHFRFGADAKIMHNDFQVDTGHGLTAKHLGYGEPCPHLDRTGKVGFTLTVIDDGWGVLWEWPGSPDQWRLGSRTPADGVELSRRSGPDQPWRLCATVTARDDAATGVMTVTTKSAEGEPQVTTYRYDPDTGRMLE